MSSEQPTEAMVEHARNAAKVFRETAELLKHGLFVGAQARQVSETIAYLERSAESMVPITKAVEKRERKVLKAVGKQVGKDTSEDSGSKEA